MYYCLVGYKLCMSRCCKSPLTNFNLGCAQNIAKADFDMYCETLGLR